MKPSMKKVSTSLSRNLQYIREINHYTLIIPKKRGSFTLSVTPSFLDKLVWCD